MCWARDPAERPSFQAVLGVFESGEVLFPGADRAKVLDYVRSIEDEPGQDDSTILFLPRFYASLVRDGLAPEAADEHWATLHRTATDRNDDHYLHCVSLFLKTHLGPAAARILRDLPPGTIPKGIAAQIAATIPTGNEELDREVIIIACKSGAAVHAAIRAVRKDHLKLALEVVAAVGVDADRTRAVCDQCIDCLESADTMCQIAGLRCLVAIGEAKRIPPALVVRFLQARDMTLTMTAHIATAKMAQEGAELPEEVLSVLIANLKGGMPLATPALVYACRELAAARYVVGKIEGEAAGTCAVGLLLRILMQIAQHESLRPATRQIMKSGQLGDVTEFDTTLERAHRILTKIASD
jgi:hypothetical protein